MKAFIEFSMPHLVVIPILLPMFTAAILVAVREKYRKMRSFINVFSCFIGIVIAAMLIAWVKDRDAVAAFGIYLPANWDVPFGITLLADRFSCMMLLICSIIAFCAALYATTKWDKAGVHFQTLFQVQIMGINGAFLTADLFNLFVFFEILLAASYGLVLHGSGAKRVKAGLHYIAINLIAAFFFLIGVALIYNVTGTLSLADIAQHLRNINPVEHKLLYTGFGILGVAFLAKAAVWPLNFWLVPAYSNASAPASAILAVLTKVGLYVILRMTCLFFSTPQAGVEHWFGQSWLMYGGMATLTIGMLGVLSTIKPARIAAFSTLVSSGTVMLAISFGQLSLTSAALYYLPVSTLAISAFFLISELIQRSSMPQDISLLITQQEKNDLDKLIEEDINWENPDEGINLDERQEEIVGRVIPAAMAFLGLSFAFCALLISGLPPLASFIAKFSMLTAMINPFGQASSSTAAIDIFRWIAIALIIISGLLALISFSRTGIRYFWSPIDRPAPRLRINECIPVIILLSACLLLTAKSELCIRFTHATSAALYSPHNYINAFMSMKPTPAPNNLKRRVNNTKPNGDLAHE